MSSLTPPTLNLPRLCTTHLILSLFSLPDIKCQLKWLLLSQNRRDYEKKSASLLQRLQKKLGLLHLPLPLYNSLLFTLHSMTQKLLLYLKPIAWSLQKSYLIPGAVGDPFCPITILQNPSNPSNPSINPSKSSMNPSKSSMNPSKSSMNPSKSSMDPSKPSMNPLNPSKSSMDPSMNPLIPSKPSMNPLKSSMNPSMNPLTPSKPSMNPLPPSKPPMNPLNLSKPSTNPKIPSRPPMHPPTPSTPLETHIESFINHLQWTQNGTINASLTFETLHTLNKLPQTSAMYTELFNLCLENSINTIWSISPQPKAFKNFLSSLNDDLSIHKNEIIPAYFVYKYQNKLDELSLIVQRLLDTKVYHREKYCRWGMSIEENMFRFAGFNGNLAGVKYFFGKLSYEERGRSLLRVLEASLMSSGGRNGWIAPLRVQEYEEHSEIAMFLLSQIDNNKLECLFCPLEKRRDFLMILGAFANFPWQESFICNVERNFGHLGAECFNFIAAGTLYKAWKYHETFGVTILENKYFGYFRRIWEKSSVELRRSYGVNYWRIFFLLGKLKEFEVVKEIYQEEGLRGRMRGALDEGERWFRVFYKRDSMGFWWWFEEEVLTVEGERRRFRGMVCEVLMEKDKDELWQEYKERGEERGRKREIKFRK